MVKSSAGGKNKEYLLTLKAKFSIISMFAGVAQLVVHSIRNRKVTCSSHATSSNKEAIFRYSLFFYAQKKIGLPKSKPIFNTRII